MAIRANDNESTKNSIYRGLLERKNEKAGIRIHAWTGRQDAFVSLLDMVEI